MKLNLWMIANQLSKFDIDSEISASAERIISGPLPVSTDGSLYVRKQGTDVLCYSDQGRILIHDMDEHEGFLLIQSIFNWYDNWMDEIENSLQRNDFRYFVHLCAKAFSNPVLFLDANSSLLGMDCRTMDIDSIPEWKYVYDNEQCSVAYYDTMMRAIHNPYKEYSQNVCRFSIFSKDENEKDYHTSGLFGSMKYQSSEYGKLIALDKCRAMNMGDVALMEILVQKASLYLAASAKSSDSILNSNVMNNLLDGNLVSKEIIEYNSSLIRGLDADRNSQFGLFVFRFNSDNKKTEDLEFLQHILSKRFYSIYTWIYHDDLLAIVSSPKPYLQSQKVSSFLGDQGYQNKVRIGVSLSFDSLEELGYYYKQAIFALETESEESLAFFHNYAHIYLLGNYDKQEKLLATEPMCRKIWFEQPDKRDFLHTVAVYLECERATGFAANRLFIHRNTLNYRVNFLKEYADWDYDDPELRDYIRLSLYYLEAQE